MKKLDKLRIPPIGMRIMKSAIAVAVCYLVSFFRNNNGIVFYSQLAALWCIQDYIQNTKQNALQRFIGTIVGAVYGLLFLLVFAGASKELQALIVSVMIIAVLYTTVLLKKKQASYFSCVVFLSIVVNHLGDANPYLFVWNRFLDTVLGILIGVCVNCFRLPREKRKDILFLSGLDDTLLFQNDSLSDFSRIELNRMLDEGLQFTVSTMRTPASLMEPLRDVRLKLPVIAMDGAVLYDIQKRKYLHTYVISNAMSHRVLSLIHSQGLECFTNVIIDDVLVIYYRETQDRVQYTLVEELRHSPYRNYVKSEGLTVENVVYFMLLYPKDRIEALYQLMKQQTITESLKVLVYDAAEYPGYAYMKIYNRNASREHMLLYLKELISVEKTVTFGSIADKYDVVVTDGDVNRVVQEIRKRYEPVKTLFPGHSKS